MIHLGQNQGNLISIFLSLDVNWENNGKSKWAEVDSPFVFQRSEN